MPLSNSLNLFSRALCLYWEQTNIIYPTGTIRELELDKMQTYLNGIWYIRMTYMILVLFPEENTSYELLKTHFSLLSIQLSLCRLPFYNIFIQKIK